MNLEGALEMTQFSDVGRVRSHNEDSTAVDVGLGLAIVADGMGGYRAGEVASAMAVKSIHEQLHGELRDLVRGQVDPESGYAHESLMLRDAVARANEIVHRASTLEPQHQGMGTTVVALLFHNDRVSIAHVGDSRAYRVRGGRLERLTRDHTLVQELVDRGRHTPQEAQACVNRNLLTRALGIAASTDVDLTQWAVEVGDVYLLCSDGLHNMLPDAVISELLTGGEEPLATKAGRLVDRANDRGGEDNVSVVLVRVTKPFPLRQDGLTSLVDWFD